MRNNQSEFISSGKRAFCIPVYQRNYDWKKNECVTLFRDIEKIAVSKKRSSHFLGTLVYVFGENSSATYNEYIIIDGQQRLTSIMLLLKAIMDSTDDEELIAEIYEEYLTNKRCPEQYRIKLKPMKLDANAYHHLLENKYDEFASSQIIENYELFKSLIATSQLNVSQIFQGILKLEIVYIQLTAEKENPQLIFESLNSTGMDLTQADLIRNFLLMGESYEKQEELYQNYWLELENTLPDTLISDFIRDFLTYKNSIIPNKKSVYQDFKVYYQEKATQDIEDFFKELVTFGKYYGWFKYCNSPNSQINDRLSQIQQLKSTVVYPFLLFVFKKCYQDNNISEENLCDILDTIISYVVRRLICEIPTNALNKVFAGLSKDLPENYSILSDEISKLLMKKSGKAAFPRDNVVKDKLISRDFFNFQHCKYVLSQIENHLSKEKVDLETTTIEHIMPQTLSAKWQLDLGKNSSDIHEKYLQRIGNLTLTGYNSELSNRPFDEKRVFYQTSNIRMNRKISEFTAWRANEINKRSEILADYITKIWSTPYVDYSAVEDESRTEYDIMDNVDVTGRAPREIVILDEIFKVSTWKSFFITICKQMYEYDSKMFESLAKHHDFQGRTKRIISSNPNELRKAEKISDSLYIETNLSANDILNYSKLVIEKFEGMDNEISYTLAANEDYVVSSENSRSDYSTILSQCFHENIEKYKSNIYQTTDNRIGILITTSKIYPGSQRNKYWFGIRKIAIEKLQTYEDSYIAFCCSDENNIIVMPVTYFINISKKLNISTDESGNIDHWHIVIYQTKDKKQTSLLLSKPSLKERDITQLKANI